MLSGLLGPALFCSAARADLPVAPPPRPAAPREAEDPAVVVERIIANSKAVTEKLAKTETGEPTQTTQATILKDIDALIDRQENPPPSGGGGGENDQNDQKDQNQQNQNQQNQGQGSGGMGKGGQQPADGQGGGQQSRGRRPRGGKDKGGQPGGQEMANAGGKNDPQPGGAKAGETGPKGPKGATPGAAGGTDPTTPPPRPTVPLDDEVAKEVWGHLPDKVRQQVTQYYREEFMPRYAELLKQYYSSLAATPGKPAEMRK
jgi:hypothetical protein